MKGIGSGFTTINYHDDSGKLLYSQEEYKKIQETIFNEVTQKRGDFIAKCIDVDFTLGEAIKWFFCKHDTENGKAFTKYILNQQFFSFGNKKNVIISLVKENPDIYRTISEKGDKNIFFGKLNSIIENRNLLAHGEVIIDFTAKNASISKYFLNEQNGKTIPLTQEYFENLQKDISWVINYCFYHLIFPEKGYPVDENYDIIWEKMS